VQYRAECDVLVLGTGAAALVAAIRAHDGGAQVLVLERSDKIGGTTSVSGGVVWVPNNHHMAEVGIPDSEEEAWTYLRRLHGGSSNEELLAAFIEWGPKMVRYLEERTPVRFAAMEKYPDYHPDWEGGKPGGRSLDNEPFDSKRLPPEVAKRIRKGPLLGPFTHREASTWGPVRNFDFVLMANRVRDKILTLGTALIAALTLGCVERSIPIELGVRARRLLVEDGRVVGVEAEENGQTVRFRARKAVVIATGGFEWNEDMKKQFLRGPELAPTSPPFNEGDGILMGMAVGARLGRMNDAWWMPSIQLPGEEYEGRQLNRLLINERAYPGSIIVNRAGRRFVNETCNYADLGKAFHVFDPSTYDYPNIPAYLIFDERYHSRYHLATVMPGDEMPGWVAQGNTPQELAEKIGVDPAGLAATIERFNRFAGEGVDHDFGRGGTIYERHYGDPDVGPNPTMAPLDTPPFYAVEVRPGSLGTKGGLEVNGKAQVLNVWGEVIPGLYACGNAAAAVTGAGYGGAGGTLGPGMTFGFLAGMHAAAE